MATHSDHSALSPQPSAPSPWWPSRYGAGDQLGTLNEITPAKLVAAARLVRTGRTFDLGRTLDADAPRFPGRYWQQALVSGAHFSNRRRPGGTPEGWGENRLNWITELVTGTLQIGTHLDGLNHLQIGDRFYIAIIGSGAGGGTLAYALAASGKKILILERGDWLRREKENWDPKAVFVEERYHTDELWYDQHDKPFRPGTNYCVGGNTKVYGAVLLRLKRIPLAGVAHQCGTVRFGHDPATAVLDLNCKAHEIDNLYVVDASFLPASSSCNPSLTIIANALRVGEHLLERMR